ncbi:Sensor histidine kinase [hydrothermal vent metagenome]|uniref:histidine kinase n=1 Tax=hydrothermal vent metagenome TaxID=652676 RepID=A0A1W1C805_9ZZZZ
MSKLLKEKTPSLISYILLRVTILMSLSLVIFFFLFKDITKDNNIYPVISIIALSFSMILYILYEALLKIQRELRRINDYLLDRKSPQKSICTTKEFSTINKNLVEVLNSAKQREIDKRKYNARLKLKNRQRSDMLSAIAHEFRNPISAIIGYSQTILDDPDIPTPLREKFLNKISNNGERIEELLSRLILWNNFERGETKLHINSFNILKIAQDIKQNLEDKYKNRTIQIKFNSKDNQIIDGDKTLIDIVIKNLVENALKYSTKDVIIKIEQNRISIIDKGIGISKDDLNKVTKKFYRTNNNSWNNSMGLGLSIVKTILNLHNTTLEIESKENIGSIFSFEL